MCGMRCRVNYADGTPGDIVETLAEVDALLVRAADGIDTAEVILASEDLDRAGVWDTKMSYGYASVSIEI